MSFRGGSQRGGIILRFLSFLVFLALLAGLYVVRHPLMRVAARAWITSDPLQRSDVIVVLGDDNFSADRSARGADIFRAGLAPRILVSGRKIRPTASIAEVMQQDLLREGIPSDAISVFASMAQNTEDEAAAVEKYVAAHNWRRVIVVTSNYHTRRVHFIYGHIFPAAGISVYVASAPDSEFDPNSWWTTRKGEELFFHEIVGYFFAMWDLRRSASAP